MCVWVAAANDRLPSSHFQVGREPTSAVYYYGTSKYLDCCLTFPSSALYVQLASLSTLAQPTTTSSAGGKTSFNDH